MARIVGIGNPLWDVFAPASSNMEVVGRFGRGSVNHLSAREMKEILSGVTEVRWVAGGGARNTLALLAALGHETYLTGAVGDDERGIGYRRALSEAGIADCLASARREPTGTCVTLMHDTGENTVIVSPGAALELEDVSDTAPRDPDVVIFEGFLAPRAGLAASSVDYAVQAGATLIVDLGHPGVTPAAAAVVGAAAAQVPDGGMRPLVFGTEAEVAAAGGVERFSASAGVVVEKRGERGAAVHCGGVETAQAAAAGKVVSRGRDVSGAAALAPGAAIIDTTGAGDVFAAAFLAARLRSMSDKRACELANLAAGMSLSSYGGRLTADQLHVFMDELMSGA
ncbi:MAG: carbohydrate kinase family protein [Spirochaetia bacterium]